jgi:hypothetical protein
MIAEHEVGDGIARIRLAGDLVSHQDVDPLIEIVGDFVRDAGCSSVEIEMIAVMDISAVAVGTLMALKNMASVHGKPLSVVGSHGRVRKRLEKAGVLRRG